jgi:predicted XRE-type DNA-binding protein
MMMDKKPLTDFEQKCYKLFMKGLTVYQICQELKIWSDFVTDARYSILAKGYELPKLEVPSTELPRCADEIVYLERKPKEERERMRAPKKELTEEERQEIIEESRSGMLQKEIAEKHGIPQSRVSRIVNSSGEKTKPKEAQYPPVPRPKIPAAVIDAVENQIKELDRLIAESEFTAASAKEDRATLVNWLEVHSHAS